MAACEVCAQYGWDHDEKARQIRKDPLECGKLICNFQWLSNRFHTALFRWFQKKYAEGERRFIIITPRNHRKTTAFVVVLCVWKMIQERTNDRILLRMASTDNSKKSLAAIADILQTRGHWLEHFFPDKVLDVRKEGFALNAYELDYPRSIKGIREHSIEARAIRSRITGGHYTIHINDDLVDESMLDSEIEQETVIKRLKASEPMFVNADEDLEIIIGTRWPGPVYRWILDSTAFEDYCKVVLGAEVDQRYRDWLAEIGARTTQKDGDPIWPEEFKPETLERIRKKDEWYYQHQMLNIEPEDDLRRFSRSWFRHYHLNAERTRVIYEEPGEEKPQSILVSRTNRILTVDPATGEHGQTDKSAIVVTAYDRETGYSFVLDAWHGRVLPDELITRILDMAEKWNVHRIAPEDVAFQKTLKYFLRQQMLRRGRTFSIHPVQSGRKAKGTRIIDSLQPFVRDGRVFTLEGDATQEEAIDQLVNMQVIKGKVVGMSPNLADAWSYHPQFWIGLSVAEEEDDEIEWWDAKKSHTPKPRPSYGLQCMT